jgi:(p)ppGpp synthase/HD superfamily hydrolase
VRNLFAGQFRGSGKTFIAHLVGTAGILVSLRVPVVLVVAGLLHAVYENGDFGDGNKKVSDSKRQRVGKVVGKQAEDYIARYAAQPQYWNPKTIGTVYENLKKLNSIERDVLLMRLANELENEIDLGQLYRSQELRKRRQEHESCRATMLKIAEELGYPNLASEFARVFEEISRVEAEIPREICYTKEHKLKLAPLSYGQRFSILFRHRLISLLRRLRSVLPLALINQLRQLKTKLQS